MALTNPRNHKMNGRELVLEYASPEAVRRGGQLREKDGERPRKKPRIEKKTYPRDLEKIGRNHDDTGLTEHREVASRERVGKDGKARPRPGAALAMAKRENVAIVQSEGKKIKF